MEKFFGVLSAVIVLASYPVYGLRVWQRKITPNIASWTIFVIISIGIFLSYASSGAKENSLVTIGPLVGCSAILVLTLIRSKEKRLSILDWTCLILGLIAIVFWFLTKQNPSLVQYALYLALFADLIGLIPTIVFLSKHPEEDRPAMWLIFSVGYFFSMFAIKENTFANWILPLFMVIVPSFIWIPLIKYRLKNNIPVKEWI